MAILDFNALEPIEFVSSIKPSFSHLDPYGHVGAQYYIEYIINHRFNCIESILGLDLIKLSKLAVRFPIASIKLDYMSPMISGREYTIKSKIAEVYNQRCKVAIGIYDSVSNKKVSNGELELVCVDSKTMLPVAWPEELINLFFN